MGEKWGKTNFYNKKRDDLSLFSMSLNIEVKKQNRNDSCDFSITHRVYQIFVFYANLKEMSQTH